MTLDDGRRGGGRTVLRLLYATLCVAAVLGALVLEPKAHDGMHELAANRAVSNDYLHTPAGDPSVPDADSGTYSPPPEGTAPTF